jgi:hypothetical protein
LFLSSLNHTLTITGYTQSGTDDGGQPTFTSAQKGTVRGRIDPRVRPEEVNGPDLNPVISDYLAITALPSGFSITERDTLADEDGAYEVLGVATLEGRSAAHHLEISLRKVTP